MSLSHTPHGTIVITREWIVSQALGIPSPPSLLPVLPKYIPCGEDTPWSRAGVHLCRVLGEYTVEGIGSVISGMNPVKDPIYQAELLYVRTHDIVWQADPREALEDLIAGGRPAWAIAVISSASRILGPSGDLGVTGSLAGLYYDTRVSDIDLVLVDPKEPGVAAERFSRLGIPEVDLIHYTGLLRIDAQVGWRRRLVNGKRVSLVMAPPRPAAHCPPLSTYWSIDPPEKQVFIKTRIPPRQDSALLYPPCVRTADGTWIVSYEYNAAMNMYRGGYVAVEGASDEGSNTVYIAVRGFRSLLKNV